MTNRHIRVKYNNETTIRSKRFCFDFTQQGGYQIIIIRHGETLENRNRIIQGHLPGQLTEVGKQQVKELCRKLVKYRRFNQIISSDSERAKETAKLISEEIPRCKIRHTAQLRERCYGVLQGQSLYRLKRLLVKNKTDIRGLIIPDGEQYEDFELRIMNFYNGLIAGKSHREVILVAHSGVLGVISEKVFGVKIRNIGNCEGFLIPAKVSPDMKLCKL
ncbi:MAG: histidine phosphatase family protein [Candidatus Ratteibacteria bacterium]